MTLLGHTLPVYSVAFSPDGMHLATGSADNTDKIWDAETRKELLTLRGHPAAVSSVAYSPDSKRLTSASIDGTVQVYAINFGDLLVLAHKRVTRDFTRDECEQYFQSKTCPPLP